MTDAQTASLSLESRFDLAYNAAHALALAALRWNGYRSESRYLVFQCIPHTLGLGPEVWRVLAICHDRRNRAEYEGDLDIDEQLVKGLLQATATLLALFLAHPHFSIFTEMERIEERTSLAWARVAPISWMAWSKKGSCSLNRVE